MLTLRKGDTTSINETVFTTNMIEKVNGNYQNICFTRIYLFVDKIQFTVSFCSSQWINTVFSNVKFY